MFIWKEDFELGIPSIDNQHKELFNIGNKLHSLLSTHEEIDDNYDNILTLLDELKDYTLYHFKTEEEIFLQCNYPEYDSHKEEHDKFIKYLNSINLDEIDGNQKVFLKELLEEIIKWVFKHIIKTDFMYKDLLITLNLK